MTAVNGHTIAYQYDGLQRQSYKHINSGKTGGGMWEGYEYVDGKTTNSTTTQVLEKRNWINDSVLSHAFIFEYDGNGNITKETRRS